MRSNLLLQILAVGLLVTAMYVTPTLAQWSADPAVNTAICTATNDQENPTIISDGSGGAIITWEDYRSGSNWDVYAQRVNASGTPQWTTNGVAVCTATGGQYDPNIVSDGSGGAIITWYDNRSGDIHIYAQRVNASGTPQWTTNGVAVCTATGSQQFPAIVSDGSHGAIITWWDYRSGSNYDIYAQRVDSNGLRQWIVSSDSNGVAICTATGDQRYPAIVSDGSGGAFITWEDHRSGSIWDVYAQRVNGGTAQWISNGNAICTATGDQHYPAIVSDGSGGAIITWQDSRGSDVDIYAQDVNASGTVQWTVGGVAICKATYDQQYPSIFSDGLGGAIITWCDSRNGNSAIYAQRVNGDSAVQWTVNGVAICNASSDQEHPTIVSDGSHGAIITWYDYRSGSNYDIYAQRVIASGAVQWTAGGAAICTATGDQQYPTIVSDGSGGAIITWQDYRSGIYDIYAQRVTSDAALPIQLASLTATTLTTGLQLQWTTVSEVNNLGFYVERKAQNAGAYATVSNLIAGAGTSLLQHHYQWTDTKVTDGNYNYRLRLVDLSGNTIYSDAITVTVSGVLGVGDTRALPTEFALRQNYPNPFNPTTVINYELPKAEYVRLVVYDMLGREVATLVNGAQDAGYKSVEFSATNLPSGIYTYRLNARPTDGGQAGTFVEVKKMLMIK
ncbi:MAG: T9SS type A sorting domain-containing protein [Bacteroidota bacterium]|jgi:CMP-2-keto-3-deoxyoctulosonic acid synthetase